LLGDAVEPQRVGAFVAQALDGAVDPFDLAQPALSCGAFPPGLQIGFQFIEAGQHFRVDVELCAPQASVLMLATRPVGRLRRTAPLIRFRGDVKMA